MTNIQPAGPRVQQARLSAELRRLRRMAGLSSRDVAAAVGIGQASVSRVETAHRVPSLPELMAWADAVRASEEQRAGLITLLDAALNEVETWRTRFHGEGLAVMQADTQQLEVSATTHLSFQPAIVPGLLQTAEYARRVFTLVDIAGGQDYAQAVAARIQRQQILYYEGMRFEFILTEAALRWRSGDGPDVLPAQIDRISTVSTLTNVRLGLIPARAIMPAIPWCAFSIYDKRKDEAPPCAAIELPHAGLTISDPSDVAIYREQFELLARTAIYGADAAALLRRVRDDVPRAAAKLGDHGAGLAAATRVAA